MSETGQPENVTRRRRRWPLAVAVALLVPVLALGGLWWRLSVAPLVLPEAVTAQVQARIDASMAANRMTLGGVEIDLEDGLGRPVVRLRDVALTDADGAPRAAFPSVQVAISGKALLRGQVRPTRIEVTGAGLRLRRDAEGYFDLALSTAEPAAEIGLQETLARIDAMFAAPEFAELEVVTGQRLELAMADEMTGQLMRVRDARMRLERGDGALTLTVGGGLEGSRDATLDIAITRASEQGRTDIGFAFTDLAARDLATAAPALAWLDLMRAPISGFLGGRLRDDGTVGDLRATLDIGPGQLSIDGAQAPWPFDGLTAVLAFEAERGRLRFDRFDLRAPELSFAAQGHADVAPDGSVFTGQLRLTEIAADPRGLFEAPLDIDGAALDLRLTLVPDLRVEIGQALIFDGDLRARARGEILAGATGVTIAIDATLPQAHVSEMFEYWPVTAIPLTRVWLDENLRGGDLRGVDFSLRRTGSGRPVTSLGLDFEAGEFRAVKTLPPITGAQGYISLIGPRLIVRLDDGVMLAPGGGAVSLAGSTMVVDDTRVRGPEAVIDLTTEATLTDLLRVLNEPPVSVFGGGPMTPEAVGTGRATMQARIVTRLQPQDSMEGTVFAVTGEVTDFASDTLVQGRPLRAERMQVEVDPQGVVVSGRASLDGVPVTGQWARALGPDADPVSNVDVRARIDRAVLARFGVDLPEWMIDGTGEATLRLRLSPGTPATLVAESDLAGLGLSLPPLGWALSQGQSGRLRAEMRLGPDPEVTALSLEADGLSLEGRVRLVQGGGLDRLIADRFRIGTWMDVRGALVGRGADRMPAIEIAGGVLDLRGAPQGRGGASAGNGTTPITATLDRLQISEGIALTGMRAEMTGGAGLSGQFRGLVNDGAAITGTLVGTGAGPAVRVRSTDGGAVLRSAGIYRDAHGGEMELILGATGEAGSYDGTLTLDGARMRDAPAMADLLNLISVVGLLEQLSGDGIALGDVDARFRLTPGRLILYEGAAVGPSMGISLDGIYDLHAGQIDMQGVVSPLYVVNGLMGALFAPRREGLFGFSYRLTGTAQDTQVSVNPLSILTPGIFRDIFRRPPPEPSEEP